MEFIYEIVGADVLDSGLGGARDDKGAGGELVAGTFLNVFLLASDEGLVDLNLAALHDAVIHDLVAEAQDNDIAWLHLIWGDLVGLAIS